jgi:hypothetical protein
MVGTAQGNTRASAPSLDAPPSSSRASGSAALVGITLVPLVVAFVALFTPKRGRILPWGDTALLELSVRDVGSHVLLLGPYSRYRWHHPGPLLFDWLAVPYRLLGSNARALNQGSLLTAAIAIGVVAWVVHRRGGTALVAWSMVVAGLLIWAVGPDVVRSPWNPWITVLPLLAVIALAWNATAGDLWSYPLAVAGGSFVVQSHVGYSAVALAILGGAGVIVLVTAIRKQVPWKPVIVAGLVSVGVLLVLWAPPVYQQVRDEPGNLSELRQFFSDAKADHDLDDGVRVTVEELGVVPAQIVGLDTAASQTDRPSSMAGVITLVALAAAVGVAAWRRCRAALLLAALVGLSILAAIWSVSRVIGPIENYLVLWVAVTGGATWITLGAALFAPGARPPVFRPNLAVMLVPVALLAAVNSWSAWQAGAPERPGTAGVEQLARAVRPRLQPPAAGPVYVRISGTGAWALAAGVMDDLERRGYRTLVQPDQAWLLGERRARPPKTAVASTLTFTDSAPAGRNAGERIARERAAFDISVYLRR